MRLSARWWGITSLLIVAANGCARRRQGDEGMPPARSAPTIVFSSPQPLPSPVATASGSGQRATVRQLTVTNAHGETTCSEIDLGEFRGGRVVDRETYSFPALNRRLAKYPELAAAIGMTEIKDCEGARLFSRRYFEYKRSHPDFDHEGPSKAEQFEEFLSDPRNVARP
jgi:hypothetical protein